MQTTFQRTTSIPSPRSVTNRGDRLRDLVDTYQTSAPSPIRPVNFWTPVAPSTGDEARRYVMNVQV